MIIDITHTHTYMYIYIYYVYTYAHTHTYMYGIYYAHHIYSTKILDFAVFQGTVSVPWTRRWLPSCAKTRWWPGLRVSLEVLPWEMDRKMGKHRKTYVGNGSISLIFNSIERSERFIAEEETLGNGRPWLASSPEAAGFLCLRPGDV